MKPNVTTLGARKEAGSAGRRRAAGVEGVVLAPVRRPTESLTVHAPVPRRHPAPAGVEGVLL